MIFRAIAWNIVHKEKIYMEAEETSKNHTRLATVAMLLSQICAVRSLEGTCCYLKFLNSDRVRSCKQLISFSRKTYGCTCENLDIPDISEFSGIVLYLCIASWERDSFWLIL